MFWQMGRRVEARLRLRAHVILLAEQGLQNKCIACGGRAGPVRDRAMAATLPGRGIDALCKDAPHLRRPGDDPAGVAHLAHHPARAANQRHALGIVERFVRDTTDKRTGGG